MKRQSFLKILSVVSATSLFLFSTVSASAAELNDFGAVSALPDDNIADSAETGLPKSYSSAELGYVSTIKYQNYNDCWVHAGLGTFESKLLREGYKIGDMSGNWMNTWATTRLDGKGWQRNIESVGYNIIAPGYFTSWYGGVLESDVDPFSFDEKVYGDWAEFGHARYGTTKVRYHSMDDVDDVKRAIMNNGGVYTAYAYSDACNRNNEAYYMWPNYNGSYIGHAVEIVGWDDNYSRTNFGNSESRRPKNDGAWFVKNSWGLNNSLGGYFWMSYEDKYVLGNKYTPSFSIEEVMELNDNVRLVQNEIYGATYEFAYAVTDDIVFMNNFKFDRGYNTIDKIMFETTSKDADYTIYYVPIDGEEPTMDEEKWTELYKGKAEYSGYICADIEDFEVKSYDGAIAVRIDNTSLNEDKTDADSDFAVSTIGICEWMTSNGEYIFINDSKHGDSYIKYNNTSYDLMDFYKELLGDDLGGTFVIKAITVGEEPKGIIGDVNLDGEITIDDVTELQKYIADIITLSDEALANADADKNGDITIDDATAIQKHLADIVKL